MDHSHWVTRILVLRHGESEWNALGRWQGQADPPLTEKGLLQAMEAARQLGSFDAVWCSPLQRAAHTAAIISEHIGVGPVQTDADLMEAAFGPWQGLTVDEIEHGWPGYLAEHRRPEGAELPQHVAERGLAALRRIAATTPGGEVLVVCHAGILRSMRMAIEAADIRFGNLGGCWMSVHHDGRVVAGDMVQLVDPRFNDLL